MTCGLWQSVAVRVGVNEPFLMRMAHGGSMGSASKTKGIPKSPPKRGITSPGSHGIVEGKFSGRHKSVDVLRVCRRFYVALMLFKLVQVRVPAFAICSEHRSQLCDFALIMTTADLSASTQIIPVLKLQTE